LSFGAKILNGTAAADEVDDGHDKDEEKDEEEDNTEDDNDVL